MEQYYIDPGDYKKEIRLLLQQLKVKNIFLVCGKSYYHLPMCSFLKQLLSEESIEITCFDECLPNPKYEDILKGINIFNKCNHDFILAVGGGSAIDTAKCIKWFTAQKENDNYLEQKFIANNIPLLAVPTTAGTGSEATQFAVVYINGEKHSVEDKSILPQYVLLYPDNLKSLSEYQKKVTVCDALAHAIESYWSVNSSEKSKELSENAICLLLRNIDAYLQKDEESYPDILLASNLAGKAINITKTTAAHAMSYKLAKMMNIPHGHAVMLCLPEVWEYMLENLAACVDERGQEYLRETFVLLAGCLKQKTPKHAIKFLKKLRYQWQLNCPKKLKEKQIDELVDSVNMERLKNFPINIKKENMRCIYRNIIVENQ